MDNIALISRAWQQVEIGGLFLFIALAEIVVGRAISFGPMDGHFYIMAPRVYRRVDSPQAFWTGVILATALGLIACAMGLPTIFQVLS